MGQQAQKGGGKKKLLRSARNKKQNEMKRPMRVKNARKRHLKNAIKSCGALFAMGLEKKYNSNPNPGKKIERRIKAKENSKKKK